MAAVVRQGAAAALPAPGLRRGNADRAGRAAEPHSRRLLVGEPALVRRPDLAHRPGRARRSPRVRPRDAGPLRRAVPGPDHGRLPGGRAAGGRLAGPGAAASAASAARARLPVRRRLPGRRPGRGPPRARRRVAGAGRPHSRGRSGRQLSRFKVLLNARDPTSPPGVASVRWLGVPSTRMILSWFQLGEAMPPRCLLLSVTWIFT